MIAAALLWLGCAVAPKGLDSFGDCAAQDSLGCTDRDGDGYSAVAGDCDDERAEVYPGADECTFNPEAPYVEGCGLPDGFDNDCNGRVDEWCASEETCDGVDNDCDDEIDEGVSSTWFADVDGDGYGDDAITTQSCVGAEGWVAIGGDCDDGDPAVSPGAEEVADGIDNDCDGVVDG